jgi:FMN-dependent oxidoreductase (nitrilotriacetate monooxygenase family)
MTGATPRKMHLGAFILPTGHHVSAWMHPQTQADAPLNLQHHIEAAKTCERGLFDMLFLADAMAVRALDIDVLSHTAQYTTYFEPLTLLSALSMVTTHLGLVSTASTSYNEPYHVARKFASLDHISGGRAGWNIVTSTKLAEALNFNREEHFEHEERYDRAHEFTEIVRGLWDSWDDDAFEYNRETARYFDPKKVHALNHRGENFSVKGPLNINRPPQGHPVLVQAGGSNTGRQFAATFADVVFVAQMSIEEGQGTYADIKSRAAKLGRDPDAITIMPGFSVLPGRTEEEANERYEYLQSKIHPLVAREALSLALGQTDLSKYDLDGPVPDLPPPTNTSQGGFKTTMAWIRAENLTIRQASMRMATSRNRVFVKGTGKQIADQLEAWFVGRAADGFNIMPSYMPGALDDFVDLVVPELQRRGLFRTAYEGKTLRDHLGLKRPESRYAKAAAL